MKTNAIKFTKIFCFKARNSDFVHYKLCGLNYKPLKTNCQ